MCKVRKIRKSDPHPVSHGVDPWGDMGIKYPARPASVRADNPREWADFRQSWAAAFAEEAKARAAMS